MKILSSRARAVRLAGAAVLFAAAGARAQVPAPADVFGFEPGADYRLATNAQIVDYFERLDGASDRVVVREIGRSVDGRPMIVAIISSEANIRNLDALRDASERLARARVDSSTAVRLAADARAVVWIDGGLHASEVAGAQHAPLLAWRVATGESEELRRIREEVVLLLVPVMNPDGLDIVASWYAANLGTEQETAPLPVLYHRYVGHDNNRDWFMMTQPETQAVARMLYDEWYPQIIYNHHQTAPFPARIFIPPFADPMNPHIPHEVVTGVNLVGSAMAHRFAQEGKPGVISRATFDMWWNGGMRTAPYFHNMIGILTETALHRYATPRTYDLESLPRTFGRSGVSARDPSVFYPNPWLGGTWRLRDAVDYMMTGSLAVLDVAAERRADWLLGIWRMGRRAIEEGAAGDPYAYLIPVNAQRDPAAASELVRVLLAGGVEVERAAEPFTAAGARHEAGTIVVRAAQPFRAYVLDLMEPQRYPERLQYPGGPPIPPYDISGWTLPLQMGVEVVRVDSAFDVRGEPISAPVRLAGEVRGGGGAQYAFSHANTAATRLANLLLAEGERVSLAADAFDAGGARFPAGTFLVNGGRRTRERITRLAAETGVDVVALERSVRVEARALRLPRVGIYKSWVANMDEGWTRFLLERFAFPLDTLHDADVRTRDLGRYDAIILPDQSQRALLAGHAAGSMPERFTGGLGVEGAAALKRYVQEGGTLITLGDASDFAIAQLGLPVRNVAAGREEDELFVPGSLLRVDVDTAHALTLGMPGESVVLFNTGGAFAPLDDDDDEASLDDAPVTYADGDVLASGWALGADRYLAGAAALARVPLGRGDVVLFGFRPQFRAQPWSTFRLLFNALHAASLDGAAWPVRAAEAR